MYCHNRLEITENGWGGVGQSQPFYSLWGWTRRTRRIDRINWMMHLRRETSALAVLRSTTLRSVA